jgi:hypothetical protein
MGTMNYRCILSAFQYCTVHFRCTVLTAKG